jgi:hypothetical protein
LGAGSLTLIVARKIDQSIFLISDTIVSYPDNRKVNPLDVKNKIVNFQNVIVAAAGVIEPVHEHLIGLPAEIGFLEMTTECRKLLEKYRQYVDFILIDPNSFHLCKLNFSGEEVSESLWIGSHQAFSRFQESAHKVRTNSDAEVDEATLALLKQPEGTTQSFSDTYFRCLRAFDQLVRSNLAEVGGFPIPFIVSAGFVGFGTYCFRYSGRMHAQQVPSVWTLVEFSREVFGSFSYYLCGSESGFEVTVPELSASWSWHSPFVKFSELAPPIIQ